MRRKESRPLLTLKGTLMDKKTLYRLLAKTKTIKDLTHTAKDTQAEIIPKTKETKSVTGKSMDGSIITYNREQKDFIELLSGGQSCVLIGAAGTGKTTCTQGAINALVATGSVTPLSIIDHKYLKDGSLGVITVAYTRRAANNIKKVLPDNIKDNCITVHKLLEYQPEYFEVINPETGESSTSMQFLPNRDASNKLPETINIIIVEESSMLGVELYNEIIRALEGNVQWVFIGDIQQLPPVFGNAILGFKMLELPLIELKQVYRQALDSPIISLAHRIISGKPIVGKDFKDWYVKDKLKIHAWKKKISTDAAIATMAAFFSKMLATDLYQPDNDVILIPFNKGFGTIEINKHVANTLARRDTKYTHEVIAGFNKVYYSVGDKVLYEKADAIIVDIVPNPAYVGKLPQQASTTLDYWGHDKKAEVHDILNDETGIDFILGAKDEKEERVLQSSHAIVLKSPEFEGTRRISSAGDINNLLHAYALTVHKAQGSEWRKVFFCLHHSHVTMLMRELLYTAVTRASKELYIICESDSFDKGITRQRIKGNTLKEKAEFFKGKLNNN